MTNETLPADIAHTLAEAMRAQGATVAPIGSGSGGRFSGFNVTLPNGQQFQIMVEEVW